MRFLLDQDVWTITARFLRELGHDVLSVEQIELRPWTDAEVLETAGRLHRILITRDRDFGALVFAQHMSPGVIYLRTSPTTAMSCHQTLNVCLSNHPETELSRAFVTVEPGRYRFRRIAP